jgi:hypothetical protein
MLEYQRLAKCMIGRPALCAHVRLLRTTAMQEMLVWVTGEAHFVMLVLFLVSGMLLSPRVRSGETVVPSDVGRFPMRTQRWVPARPLRYLPKSG